MIRWDGNIESLITSPHTTVVGTNQVHQAWIIARLSHHLSQLVVVVVPSEEGAQTLLEDIVFFAGGATYLPAERTTPYVELFSSRSEAHEHFATLHRLVTSEYRFPLVMSGRAISRRTLPLNTFKRMTRKVVPGDVLDREQFVATLLAAGYRTSPIVDDPATFAVRGGLVDVFVPSSLYPVRIEFFDDEVESLRLFDPETQRTLRNIDALSIHPTSIIANDGVTDAKSRLIANADRCGCPSRVLAGALDKIRTYRELNRAIDLEELAPAFHPRLQSVSSYVPNEAVWVVVEPDAIASEIEQLQRDFDAGFASRKESGRYCFPPDEYLEPLESITSTIAHRVDFSSVPDRDAERVYSLDTSDNSDLRLAIENARSQAEGRLSNILHDFCKRRVEEGELVVIAASDESQVDRLETLLGSEDYEVEVCREVNSGWFTQGMRRERALIKLGHISEGLCIPGEMTVVASHEVFGTRRRMLRHVARDQMGPQIDALRDLSVGDLVVHAEHGIGRYEGLTQLTLGTTPAEYMLMVYAGSDRLYLPVHRMSQVHRYIGGVGRASLDRLGGVTWRRKTRNVKADVRKLGEDLLQLYAQRAALDGYAHPEPDHFFREFESSFPFSETPDQLQAINDTLADLSADRPMDRLICGDVGFGKTEIAVRAAFLVAQNGLQVALLVPTTVLSEQHLRTFKKRLENYPLRIEVVNRFHKKSDMERVLQSTRDGKVDVLIGTHRLLSSDVQFKRLGLLIIDEEQRFGVKHKEQMKRMRTQVDVLALSATPIPRTLQLSMVGLREISVINTPPHSRVSVRTLACKYDDSIVLDGVQRELSRNGQVFFVHNEVQSIDYWASRLRSMMPGIRFGVAHGKMDGRRLERTMLEFVRGETSVLVCTAIIESGLDIPRANTIFINRAHCFGLAQLHQLRGRVGRSHQRAYCYLLVPDNDSITEEARQRLNVLQRFTKLGSGFSIANYDLEIRGAGDLLGRRQSGHIAAVGFETYAQILNSAVAELKGQPIVTESDPDLKTTISAFIPDDYVSDMGQRLELYKRLSDACRDRAQIAAIVSEIEDRYGKRPPEVEALSQLMQIKGLASALGITVVELTDTHLRLTFLDTPKMIAGPIVTWIKECGFQFTSDKRLVCRLNPQGQVAPLTRAKKILRRLCDGANQTI